MIVHSNYQMSTPYSSKTGLISIGDLVIETSNIPSFPSASDLEAQELEEDLIVAQKSHLEYLSGTGRPFEEFLAELRREEDRGEVSD